MPSANVKLGVEYSQFKRGMNEAQGSVKTLTEALKANESQLKLTGDKELYLKNKVDLLNQQIEAQRTVVANAMKALQELDRNGVDKASKTYQDMERNVYKATDQLNKMQAELKDVETGADLAGKETGEMNDELKNIGKGVSWDNLTTGLDSIIGKLESGARAAVNFGRKIINSAKGSTGWADDLLTTSARTGIDIQKLQQMEQIAHIVEVDTDAIVTAQDRMKRATQSKGGKQSIEEVLGISLNGQTADDLFWEVGDALANMGEEFDKEAAAQQVFGRGWRELLPLFQMGRQAYEQMLSEQTTLTDEQVRSLGEADDAIKSLELQIQQMKNQFWAENADKITELMQWIVDNKDAVVTALEAIGIAFGGLKLASFAANLAKAINGFKELGLLGAGKAASDTVAAGGAGKAIGSGLGAAGLAGITGAGLIGAGFLWAADRRNNHADQVRGTNEYLVAQSSGVEQLLANYILAEKAANSLTYGETAAEIEAIYARVDETYKALMGANGGAEALSAYSDWRQERSYGNMDWELPESLEKMVTVAGEMNGQVADLTQTNADMTAAVGELSALPANMQTALENAIRSGMNGVTIVVNQSAVDTIGRRIAGGMGRNVIAMTR